MNATHVRPASTPEHAAWTRVLLAPFQQRHNRRAMWFWIALFTLGSVAFAVAAKSSEGFEPAWFLVALACLAGGWWLWLVASVQMQNHPVAAHTVPGHVRTLRRVLAVVGIALSLVSGAVGAAFGFGWVALGGSAVALIVASWLVRLPMLGLFFWIVPTLGARWGETPMGQAIGDRLESAWLAHPSPVVAFAAAVLWAASIATLRGVVREGDRAHRRHYRFRSRRQAAQDFEKPDAGPWSNAGPAGAALVGLSTALYRLRLASACSNRSGSVPGRALMGLGPSFHWSGQAGSALVYGSLIALMLLLIPMIATIHAVQGTHATIMWPAAFALAALAATDSLAARRVFYVTRHEQALLMLLPGMPRNAALNRSLAWRLLARFSGIWIVCLLVGAAVVPVDQWRWLQIFALCGLPSCALLWRDWSRLPPASPLTAGGPVFAISAASLAIQLASIYLGVTLWQCATVSIALTAFLLIRGWRSLDSAPSAFPAARRGQAHQRRRSAGRRGV